MDSNIMTALYHIRKNQIIQFYRLDPEKSQISNSFAYALSNDCYPFFHSDEEMDIYSECFKIKKELIEKIVKFIDNDWLKKKYYTFYELEDIFGHGLRVELIVILRYCFLDNRFGGDEFWKKMLSFCPAEATSLNEPLTDWEI